MQLQTSTWEEASTKKESETVYKKYQKEMMKDWEGGWYKKKSRKKRWTEKKEREWDQHKGHLDEQYIQTCVTKTHILCDRKRKILEGKESTQEGTNCNFTNRKKRVSRSQDIIIIIDRYQGWSLLSLKLDSKFKTREKAVRRRENFLERSRTIVVKRSWFIPISVKEDDKCKYTRE